MNVGEVCLSISQGIEERELKKHGGGVLVKGDGKKEEESNSTPATVNISIAHCSTPRRFPPRL